MSLHSETGDIFPKLGVFVLCLVSLVQHYDVVTHVS
jgi:hypothetical protein